MQVRSLGQEDPREEEAATHSSLLAWRAPWTEEPGGLQSMGSQRVKRLSTHAPDEQISESHTRAQSQGHLSNVRGRDQVDSGARHKDLPPNPGSSGSRAALSRRTGSSRPPQNAVPTC